MLHAPRIRRVPERAGGFALCWIGAPSGSAWRHRSLKLAFGFKCAFRPTVIKGLDGAGIDWDIVVETESDCTIEATVSAYLAVHTMLEGTEPPHLERVDHNNSLPKLPAQKVNLYGSGGSKGVVHDSLADMLRCAFRGNEKVKLSAA